MSPGLLRRIALLFGLILVGFWLSTEFVALPWAISGDSMEPGLSDGDRVLVDLWTYRQRPPRPGEVLLLRGPLPARQTLVKRAWKSPSDKDLRPRDGLWPNGPHRIGVWVLGDRGSASTDSRDFGSVPETEIRGRVLLRYWPPTRAGLK